MKAVKQYHLDYYPGSLSLSQVTATYLKISAL